MAGTSELLAQFGQALTGNTTRARNLAAGTLDSFSTADHNRTFDLLRNLYMSWMSSGSYSDPVRVDLHPFFAGLHLVPPAKRAAIVLRVVLKLNDSDISYVLKSTPIEVSKSIQEGFQNLSKIYGTKVYIVEPEPVVSLEIERALDPFFTKCTRFNYSDKNVLDDIISHKPDIIISEARLSTKGDGVALAKSAAATLKCPVIFETNWPMDIGREDFVYGRYTITKPFNRESIRSTFVNAFSDKFYISYDGDSDETEYYDTSTIVEVVSADATDFSQAPAPLSLVVERGKLAVAHTAAPQTKIPLAAIEDLMEAIANDVRRVLDVDSNMPPSYFARLNSLLRALEEPITESSAIRLAIFHRGLEKLKPAILEYFEDVAAADLIAICESLDMAVRQFPIWRVFLAEASHEPTLTNNLTGAVRDITDKIVSQPDDVVSPEIKREILSLTEGGLSEKDPVINRSVRAVISNAYKAIGVYFKERLKGAGTAFNASIDKQVGEGLATGLTNLVIASSTVLTALAGLLPAEFAWVGALIVLARTIKAK